MEKPIELKLAETKQILTDTISTCGLPIFCITPILKDLLTQVLTLESENYARALQEYEESLKEQTEE